VSKLWAYLVGLIAADGHVEKKRVVLAQKDVIYLSLVWAMLARLGVAATKPFLDKRAGVYKIYINSREFHRRVVAYVPMGRKSNVLPPPPLEGEEALMYIAGFTDGDGWVEHIIKKRGEKRYCYLRIGIKTKSQKLRDWMYDTLLKLGIRAHKADKKSGYEVHIDTPDLHRLGDLLLNPTHVKKLALLQRAGPGRETPGLHASCNGGDSGIRPRKGEAIP
jgi:hypothetical protein